MGNEVEHEEHARLVLMDLVEADDVHFGLFMRLMRDEYKGFDLKLGKDLYTKYMGFDGRQRPTHDLNTGLPLRSAI